MIKMEDIKPKVIIKDEVGECLNCGTTTHFYDEGYFCSCNCREEYKEKVFYKTLANNIYSNIKEVDEPHLKIILTERQFELLKQKYKICNGGKNYSKKFMGIPIEII